VAIGDALPALHTPNVGLTYYVNATTGNDTTGTGASGAPWASLQKAYTYLRDTATWPTNQDILIEVAAGTYQRDAQQYTLDTWYNGTGRQPTATQWVIWNFAPGAVVKLPSGTSPTTHKGAMRLDTVSSGVSSYQMFIGMEIDGEQTRTNSTGDAVGVYFSGSTSNVQLVDCVIHGIYAMDTDDGSPTSKAQGVTGGTTATGHILWGCELYDIGTLAGTITIQEHAVYLSGDDCSVVGCVIYDIPNGYGVQFYDSGNAIVGSMVASSTIASVGQSCIVVPGHGSDLIIKNNILVEGRGDAGTSDGHGVEYVPNTATGSGNVIANNIFYDHAQADIETTLAGWTYSDNTTADPLFTDYASRDFTLQSGSPAIGHADESYSTVTDFAGVTRDGTPDAGAYELAVVPVTGSASATFAFASYSKLRDDELNQLEDAGGNPLLMPGVSGYVNLSDEVGGAAAATFTFTAAAAGVPDTTGTATATWVLTATAAGVPDVTATAVASWAFSGAASGVPDVTGTAAATWSFTGSVSAAGTKIGTASATFAYIGMAAGSSAANTTGTAAATFTYTGTAAGYRHIPALTDAFTGTTIDTTKWTVGAGATQDDRLILPALSSYAARITSVESFLMAGSSIQLEVTDVPTGANVEFGVQFGDATNDIEMGVKGDEVFTRVTEGGSSADNDGLATLDGVSYRRWRIVEDEGFLYFQAAPLIGSWVSLDTRPTPDWVYTEAHQVIVYSGWHTTATTPGDFEVDNFNVATGVHGAASATWTISARHKLRDENGDIIAALVPLTYDGGEQLTDHLGEPLTYTEPIYVAGIGAVVIDGAEPGGATATWQFNAAIVGIRGRNGTAAATWQLAMTATGASNETGAAAATYTLTATAAGVPDVAGAAAATWGFTATAAAAVTVSGAAAAAYTLTASAEGDVEHTGTAAATWQFDATAVAEPVKAGQVAATWEMTATAAGARGVTGAAAATYTLTSETAGESGTLGAASATWGFSASAAGITDPKGSASATFTFTAEAAGLSVTAATATATWGFTAAVIGVRDTPGTAAATFELIGHIDVDAGPVPQRERTRTRRHRPTTTARRPRHTTAVRRHST
jgi:hypothetical protein